MKSLKNHQLINLAYLTIPKDLRREELVNRNGVTQDIIDEIKKTDAAAFKQTAKFAQLIAGPSIDDTLQNIYKFIKTNIHYQVDGFQYQKIKTPSSVWHTRICDCKGYSIFIRSILKNLKIKSHLKFAAYEPGRDVSHVYVIVPKKDGTYVTLDGCMPGFNVEKQPVKTILS